MNSIVPPPTDSQTQHVPNHPDLPERGDDEDFVEYLNRVADWFEASPPEAPAGFRLIECERDSRHHPLYEVAEDVFYPRPCPDCAAESYSRDNREKACKLQHRRWKSWRILGWLASRAYPLGIIAGSGTSYGRCEFCGIKRQHLRPRWKGKRPYVLGVQREAWSCLLRRGHRFTAHYGCGLCAICYPCPDCGSSDPEHYSCEAGA